MSSDARTHSHSTSTRQRSAWILVGVVWALYMLTAADQITYNKALADIAHRYGLGIALKNDPDQVKALEPFFDFSVAEECAKYGECSGYAPFTAAGKAVLHVEYEGSLASFCPTTKALGFSSLLKKLNLDAWRSPCP